MAAAPPPPRELVDDVIPEILLRLPPDEPKWLFRAALVCKPWLRTISGPAFLRRYRAFHGAAPLLGFVDMAPRIDRVPRFVATTTAVPAFPIPVSDACSAFPLDCRHGRVLIREMGEVDLHYLVCDPITGDRHRVPYPDAEIRMPIDCAAAMLCAVTGCQHLDCHGGPFYVILMFCHFHSHDMFATTYSSEMGSWSAPAALHIGMIAQPYGRGALLGEGIYFLFGPDTGIVKYDLGKNCLAVVEPPPLAMHNSEVALTVIEDGSLGLAAIRHSSLYLWSRAVSSVENAEWVQCRVIDLEKMMPMANPSDGASVFGFAVRVGVIFIDTDVGLFMIELNSGQVEKVGEPRCRICVLPYMSFYAPDRCKLPLRGGPTDL